ncbi:MAG: hypothetical protein QM777_02355 [Pseudorhodoferax sp.]
MPPEPPFTLNLRSDGLAADEHRHKHAQPVLPLAGHAPRPAVPRA